MRRGRAEGGKERDIVAGGGERVASESGEVEERSVEEEGEGEGEGGRGVEEDVRGRPEVAHRRSPRSSLVLRRVCASPGVLRRCATMSLRTVSTSGAIPAARMCS